ncbi:MAG: response regulator [Humidesulfovibrio sp.]|uniref:response regulator n=1 Tax=Humidesulfovibrio sp. TaxID=2910988 RepID=UPI0027350C48|nr:response regulator [Humidesulfovibrio sp.]MDP2849428.1 response regulator [Humidesulfovibrio sp.]
MKAVDPVRYRPRILVADDETIIAMQIGELLEAEGYELAGVAATASQAVEMARDLRPDLVLMDIVMPCGGADDDGGGMGDPGDGIDACAMIQRDLRIPVVLLSAHGEEHFLRRARRALPSAYLVKPCQNTQIRAAIEVALALRAGNDPSAPFRLREAHHRIKNSFSLLHSMLRIQEIQAADPQAKHSLADAGARVLALAKAHESMVNGGPESMSDARSHVERLATALFGAQSPPPPQAGLSLELDVEAMGLLPAQVIPCGIFLAEALTNAIKHAFPEGTANDGQGGVIRVELHASGAQAELSIADNGRGLAGDPVELGRNSFGLQCLQAAAEQLEGRMSIASEPGRGARVTVLFPLCLAYQSRSA